MAEIPRPGRNDHALNPFGLEATTGLRPLHMDPPAKTTGLRPLGQVEGLSALEPTTLIFPESGKTGDKETEKRLKTRLATGLDWDPE